MKTALKWVGWGILALILLAAFAEADALTRWGVAILGAGYWILRDYERRAEQRRQALDYRLKSIEQKLDAILCHPLNTRYISDGIEGLVDEYRARTRHSDGS